MRISQAFPSKYIKAADLQGRDAKVAISHVTMEDVEQGQPPLPVVHFLGAEKGMVLNKTNASTIVKMYGDDTDAWQGREVTLFVAQVEFKGDIVEGLRIKFAAPPLSPTVLAAAGQAPIDSTTVVPSTPPAGFVTTPVEPLQDGRPNPLTGQTDPLDSLK